MIVKLISSFIFLTLSMLFDNLVWILGSQRLSLTILKDAYKNKTLIKTILGENIINAYKNKTLISHILNDRILHVLTNGKDMYSPLVFAFVLLFTPLTFFNVVMVILGMMTFNFFFWFGNTEREYLKNKEYLKLLKPVLYRFIVFIHPFDVIPAMISSGLLMSLI